MLALLLVAAAPATMRLESCPAASVRTDGENVGDRAIVSSDGARLVLQCGDGAILAWRDGSVTRLEEGLTLFEAGKREGLVAEWATCPTEARTGPASDCTPVDASSDQAALLVLVSITPYVLRRNSAPVELDFQFGPGTFARTLDRLWLADSRKYPGGLAELSVGAMQPRTIATFPTTNLLFEDGEGEAQSVAYAAAPDLFVVTFGGAFRVANEIALLRAYDRKGIQRWSYRAKLPPRDGTLIVGEFPTLFTLLKGQIGVLGRSNGPSRYDILDLRTGKVIGGGRGQPLAAARDGNVLLARTGPQRVEIRTIQNRGS